MAVLQGKEGKRLRSARRWCGGRGHTPARPARPARAAAAASRRTRRTCANSPSSSTRAIEALAEALAAAAARRRQLSPPPRAVAKPKRPAHRRHRPAPIRLRSPGRPVWAARTEPGAPGSRALDAVGVCARHAWHWHGAAGAHCGAAGAMHRVNGRGVRQAHRSRRAVRAAPAPSTLLVAARRPPAGWLGHHLPAGQERALTWQVAAWISSEWAARGARCEGRRRTCSGVPAWAAQRSRQPHGGTRWDAVGRRGTVGRARRALFASARWGVNSERFFFSQLPHRVATDDRALGGTGPGSHWGLRHAPRWDCHIW